GKSSHIRCPYPDHEDQHPSWRWNDAKSRAHCTCTPSASIFDVVCKVKGIDFEAAKIWVAETIGRSDLIVQPGGKARKNRKGRGRGSNTSGNNGATAQHRPGCTLAASTPPRKISLSNFSAHSASVKCPFSRTNLTRSRIFDSPSHLRTVSPPLSGSMMT